MRTKALLCAAILAAGAVTSMAQSNVYSLNVVGYVQKAFKSQFFVLVANPLNAATNDLQTMFQNPPDNTQVYRWSVAAQDLNPTVSTYSAAQTKWLPNQTISPGEGFFVVGGADFTNTFIGDVPQGSLTNQVAGNGNFQAIASIPPVGGSLTNVLAQYPATDNDQVYTWNVTTQDLNPTVSTYSAAQSKWLPDQDIPVGDGFFIARAGAPVTYVRTFTVQ